MKAYIYDILDDRDNHKLDLGSGDVLRIEYKGFSYEITAEKDKISISTVRTITHMGITIRPRAANVIEIIPE